MKNLKKKIRDILKTMGPQTPTELNSIIKTRIDDIIECLLRNEDFRLSKFFGAENKDVYSKWYLSNGAEQEIERDIIEALMCSYKCTSAFDNEEEKRKASEKISLTNEVQFTISACGKELYMGDLNKCISYLTANAENIEFLQNLKEIQDDLRFRFEGPERRRRNT